MQSDLYRCSECSAFYDRGTHIPKLIPTCGHTFCSECLSTMIIKEKLISCPLDKITLLSFAGRSDQFPTNLLILQAIDLKMKREFDTCEKHGEPKILVCTTDCSCICKICQEEHKDHTIKHIKDIKAEADVKRKQLHFSLDEYKAQTEEIERLFEGTRKSLATFFKNKFDEMRDALTRKEKEFFQEMDQLLENEKKETEKKLNQNTKIKSRMETQICDLETNTLNQRFFRTLSAKIPSIQVANEIERLKEVSQGFHKQYELELNNFSNLVMSTIQEVKIKNESIPAGNSEPEKVSLIVKKDKVNEIAKNKNILSIIIQEDTALVNLKESSEDNADEAIDFTDLNLFKQIGPVHLVLGKQHFTVDGGQASKSLWKLFGDVFSFIIPFASAGFQETNLTLICSDVFRETNQIKVFELKKWKDVEIPRNQGGWGSQGDWGHLGNWGWGVGDWGYSSPKKGSILQRFSSQLSQVLENLVTFDLDLRRTSINNIDIEALFSKTKYFSSSLKVFALNLSFTKITDKSIRILTDELPVESLEGFALFLAGCEITDSSIKYFCDHKKNSFKKIKAFTLDLSQTDVTQESILALQGFLPSMLSLNKLGILLNDLLITDNAIKNLLLSLKESIQSLEEFTFQLNRTHTSDSSIEYLANHLLRSISNLKSFTLKLDKTPVTDQSFEGFCQNLLRISKNLEFLVLSVCHTNVTRKGTEFLINCVNCGILSQLKFVCIRLYEDEEITLMR